MDCGVDGDNVPAHLEYVAHIPRIPRGFIRRLRYR